MLGKFVDSVKRRLARAKAVRTAKANALKIVALGYRFGAVRDGLFQVFRPGEETPAYTVQIYRDNARGKVTYVCKCTFFEKWGFCKHGDGLVMELQRWTPLVRCAANSPEPGSPEHGSFPPQNNYAVAANLAPCGGSEAVSPSDGSPMGRYSCIVDSEGRFLDENGSPDPSDGRG